MTKKSQRPIGVFDSGLGGLTIVKELRKHLPHEDIIYLGDIARLPYGIKSKKQICLYSLQNSLYLATHRVKGIVIACNSSSSAASSYLKSRLEIPFFDVIQPAVNEVLRKDKVRSVGVIGTNATIDSGAYSRKLLKRKHLKVLSKACPLFVPLVEEGLLKGMICEQTIKQYLAGIKRAHVQYLIMGCTHYPLLKSAIQKYLGKQTQVINSAEATAKSVKDYLVRESLLNASSRSGALTVCVTDKPRGFIRTGERFLKEKIRKIKVVRVDG